MNNEPLTRGQAVTWWAILYFLSVLANLSVFWLFKKTYHYGFFEVLLGHFFYTVMFICAWSMGTVADPDELKKGVVDGLRTVIQPAPYLMLVFVICLLLVLFILKLPWTWRAVAPLACGIIAGIKWARQKPDEAAKPSSGKEPPTIDVWKP